MHLPGVPSESSVAAAVANGTAPRIDHRRFPLETFRQLRETVLQYVEDRARGNPRENKVDLELN